MPVPALKLRRVFPRKIDRVYYGATVLARLFVALYILSHLIPLAHADDDVMEVSRKVMAATATAPDLCSFMEEVVINHGELPAGTTPYLTFLRVEQSNAHVQMILNECYQDGYTGVQGERTLSEYMHSPDYRDDITLFWVRSMVALNSTVATQ